MRSVLCFVIWLASALLVGRVIGDLHRPRETRVEADFAAFLEQKNEYDLLFFGSSRMYRGVVPRIFDERMASLGFDTRSYNLAMRGMLAHEVNELLRRVLAQHPARLRNVVIELADWAPRRKNYFTHRTIAWHDWSETLSAIRTRWREEQPWLTRLEDTRIQLLQLGARASALGLAAEGTREWFNALTVPGHREQSRAAFDQQLRVLEAGRGHAPFSPAEYRSGLTGQHRVEFRARLDEYLEHVQELPRLNAADVPLDSFNLPALEAQVEAAREAGLRVVYVIPPSFEEQPVLHGLIRAGEIPHPLAFDDPVRWPELYRPDQRFDLRHLNESGARRFTQLLADGVADYLSQTNDAR